MGGERAARFHPYASRNGVAPCLRAAAILQSAAGEGRHRQRTGSRLSDAAVLPTALSGSQRLPYTVSPRGRCGRRGQDGHAVGKQRPVNSRTRRPRPLCRDTRRHTAPQHGPGGRACGPRRGPHYPSARNTRRPVARPRGASRSALKFAPCCRRRRPGTARTTLPSRSRRTPSPPASTRRRTRTSGAPRPLTRRRTRCRRRTPRRRSG